jgi:guanylate kinase
MARARKIPRIPGNIFVISAPSGAGKTTLVNRLLASVPGLAFSVSHTTRAPRAGEKHGREYFFVTSGKFRRMIDNAALVEWANVFGNYYGTSWKQLRASQRSGTDVLLDIDVQGHQQIKKLLPEAVSIFILPPSFSELEHRLRRRHLDAPETIRKRLAFARQEITHWPEYDYLIVNDNLARASQALKAVVMAARFRKASQQERAREISQSFGGSTDGFTDGS